MHQGNRTPPRNGHVTKVQRRGVIEETGMRVLIVEDDAALGLFLQKGLKLEGHEVAWVGDGVAALEQVEALRPDLMVLDLSLPRKDGTEVLEEMRGKYDDTAVLVLTGRSMVEERVRCLNLGADDCLLKPFSFHELTARCRALLRRRERFADPVLRHGDVELNRMERRVTRNGRAVELTAKEFSLLEFLMQRKGGCCTRSRAAARGLADVAGCGDECGGCVRQLSAEEVGRGECGWRFGSGD